MSYVKPSGSSIDLDSYAFFRDLNEYWFYILGEFDH